MSGIRRIQQVYYSVLFLFWFATALPAALGVLVVTSRGVTLGQLGTLLGAYSLTIVLLEVPTGGLADVIGRKQVALLAYSFAALGAAAYFFALNYETFVLAFVLNGVGRALASGALDAWFVDALHEVDPQIELQPLLARGGTVALLALGLGTLCGSLLPYALAGLPAEGTARLTPFSSALLAGWLVQMVTVVVAFLGIRENRITTAPPDWRETLRATPVLVRTAVGVTRQNSHLPLLLGATFASALAVISLEMLWQPHFAGLLGRIEGNSLYFGLIMGGNFLMGMVGNLVATPLSRYLGKRYALVAALFQAARAALMILLALQTGFLPALAAFWLVYFNMGVVNSPHATLFHQAIPAQIRSTMLSFDSLVGYVGAFLGSVGLGLLAEHTSTNVAWMVAATVVGLSALIYLQLDAKRVHPQDHQHAIFEGS